MSRIRRLAVAGLVLVGTACTAGDDADDAAVLTDTLATTTPPVATAPPADTGMGGMQGAIALMAVNNSNHTGEATITASGNQTQVMVQLNGPEDRTHPGHIHSGTCDSPGGVVAPLESITTTGGTGTATSTANVPMATVMNGQHIVQYHTPDGTRVVCGNIPGHTM
jgi:Cu/Zn superoxide dismutase